MFRFSKTFVTLLLMSCTLYIDYSTDCHLIFTKQGRSLIKIFNQVSYIRKLKYMKLHMGFNCTCKYIKFYRN